MQISANNFPERLAQALAMRGWTVSDLVRKAGIAFSTVTRWSKEGRAPQSATLRKLAEVLNVDRAWLEHGTGEMQRKVRYELSEPMEKAVLRDEPPFADYAARVAKMMGGRLADSDLLELIDQCITGARETPAEKDDFLRVGSILTAELIKRTKEREEK